MKRKIIISYAGFLSSVAFLACVLVVLLSGVALKSAPRDESAKARLDYDAGMIVLPLDEYRFPGDHDLDLIDSFFNAVRSECMRERGYDFALPQFEGGYLGYDESRRYGFWNVELAKKHGSDLPPSSVGSENQGFSQAFQDLNRAYHDSFEGKSLDVYQQDIMDCVAKADKVAGELVPELKDLNAASELVTRLTKKAVNKVRGSREWNEVKDKYGECLEDLGLTQSTDELFGSQELFELTALPDDANVKVTVGMAASEQARENIRLTTLEAECNQKVGAAQTLANLEASYQQGLINQNEVALNREKERRKEAIRVMEEYVEARRQLLGVLPGD